MFKLKKTDQEVNQLVSSQKKTIKKQSTNYKVQNKTKIKQEEKQKNKPTIVKIKKTLLISENRLQMFDVQPIRYIYIYMYRGWVGVAWN